MHWMVSELPRYMLLAFILAAVIRIAQLSKRPNLNAFPTAGSSSWLGSWLGSVRFMINATDIIQEGYKKHKGVPFKIATLDRWVLIVSSRAHIEELRSAHDDEFSSLEPLFEDLNFEFTVGPEIMHTPYQVSVTRSQLNRNLGVLYPPLRDEIVTAFEEILDLKDDVWKSIPAFATIQQVVCRASNRAFVGLPLCRDPDFVALNLQYTIDVVTAGIVIGFFPKILKPLVARLVSKVPRNTGRAVRHLRPIIEERRKYLEEYGNEWTEKPRDFLSWVMDEAGPSATVESLTNYMLSTNFASVHTTSDAFTKALYNLASNPQYVQPLREEVEAIVKREGWSRTSLSKMRKVDSFLKESMRMDSFNVWGMTRQAKKDVTFSDGTFIPKGTRIHAPIRAIHLDDALYERPEVFDGFRFVDMGGEDGEGTKYQFVSTSPEYLPFGHGRHACSGRHFAAVGLKTMLAHVVTSYDIALEEGAGCPRGLCVGTAIVANPTAKVMFRKRTRQDDMQ